MIMMLWNWLRASAAAPNQPSVVIVNMVKGKGVSLWSIMFSGITVHLRVMNMQKLTELEEKSMRDAFVAELTQLAAVIPCYADHGDLGFGVLDNYAAQFPEQFLNAGVAEQNMTGLACGLALEGQKVYTYSIANFTTLRPLEQIRNDICHHDAM